MLNLEFVIPAIIIGAIGGFNFNFEMLERNRDEWRVVWFWKTVVCVLITGFCFWAGMPAFVAPFGNVFFFILVYWAISLAIDASVEDSLPKVGAVLWILLFCLALMINFAGCKAFRAEGYRSLIGEVKENDFINNMSPIDESRMRVVSEHQAQYLADKVLGESNKVLGSRYELGRVHISQIKGELFWIAPLEFRGFFQWNKFSTSAGYVMVSAEDDQRRPVLVDTLNLRFLPSACFGDNLLRHVYTNGYNDIELHDLTFELDDNYKPFYTITATKPTLGFDGDKVFGVVVVDPVSGEITWYDINKTPEWVDRVIPAYLAEDYINSWGELVKGYLNTWFSHENMLMATPYRESNNSQNENVWFVTNAQGETFWYTGITSVGADQALTGIMLLNSKTGQAYYSKLSGSNEQAIVAAVSNALGSDGIKWRPTMPIPYNIYGELSFVVPVVGVDQPILQKIAIVKASNLKIGFGRDKKSALADYRRVISTDGNIVAPTHESEGKTVSAKIKRIGAEIIDGRTNYSILLDSDSTKLFLLTSEINPEIVVAKPGDEVIISFIMTAEEVVPVTGFDLLCLTLKKSRAQIAYEEKVFGSEDTLRQAKNVSDARKELGQLTPEDLFRLQKLSRSRSDK